MKCKSLDTLKKRLDHPGFRYADAALDSLYLASSMVGYTASCATTNLDDANQAQADFYQSNTWELALLEMLCFISYGVLAAHGKHQENALRHLAVSWPYFRDLLSGLKNGRHAVLNVSFLMQQSIHHILYAITNPFAIGVGVLLAANLIWYRHMSKQRNQMIKHNQALLKKITEEPPNSNDIKQHTALQRITNYSSAAFDGITDGAYLYGCLFILIGLGVNALAAGLPLILAIVTISLINIMSLITKLHNEYLAQHALQASYLACQAALTNTNNALTPTQNHWIKKLLFTIGRAVLSGAKNATMAIASIQAFLSNTLAKFILGVGAIVCAVLYATYLGLKSLFTPNDSVVNPITRIGLFAFQPPSPTATQPAPSPSQI